MARSGLASTERCGHAVSLSVRPLPRPHPHPWLLPPPPPSSRARSDLNYVPLFFPNTDLSSKPAISSYMARCAARPAFGEAFGAQHASLVARKTDEWLKAGGGKKFGLF